jgi:hypothetical protein
MSILIGFYVLSCIVVAFMAKVPPESSWNLRFWLALSRTPLYLWWIQPSAQKATQDNIDGVKSVAGAASDLVHTNDKKCPDCAEFVKKEALKCRFCQFKFTS